MLENSSAVSYKIKYILYDFTTPFLGIYKNKVFFIISRNCKQSKCISTWECINKLWYIHTMAYSSEIRNEPRLHMTEWTIFKWAATGLPNLTTMDSWGQMNPSCGVHAYNPGSSEVLSSTTRPYLPPASRSSTMTPVPLPKHANQSLRTLPDVPCGASPPTPVTLRERSQTQKVCSKTWVSGQNSRGTQGVSGFQRLVLRWDWPQEAWENFQEVP